MRQLNTFVALSLAAVFATATSAANAAAIDVQFARDPGHEQTGAAVVGSAGDIWNTFLGNANNGSLVDTGGAASGVSLSFSAAMVYDSVPSDTQFTGTPYANLMQGYLVDFIGSQGIDMKFSGLVAGHEYGFWVYTQGDNNNGNRQLSLSANGGPAQTTTQGTYNTFVLDHNYTYLVSFADIDGVVDLVAHDLNGEANINGVQLMAVPEPTSIALMLAGVLFCIGAARRQRAR
jgi:hypothetical protein